MADFDLVVRGNLVFADRIVENGFLAIRDGKIAMVGEGAPPAGREHHNFSGAWIVPGVVDGQVHTGSPGIEGLARGSRAAAAGGVTVMVDMPYDAGAPVWTVERFNRKAYIADHECHVDTALFATIDPRAENALDVIPGMIAAGACAFKFSLFEANKDRFPRVPDDLLYEAMLRIAPSGLACGVHNQDQEIASRNITRKIAAGKTGPLDFCDANNALVENLATARIYEIGAATGVRAHAVHVSLSRGFELSVMYKRAGVRATVETCVQYLMLNREDDAERLGALIKHYPPLRPRSEVDKLWTHIAAGHCDFISSDHSSWPLETKSDPNIFMNTSGGPGLETLLPATWTGFEEHGLSPTLAVRLLSTNPAAFFLLADKGSLDIGKDADFVVLEPGKFVFDPANSLSAVNWSAFAGRTFTVRIGATFLRGAAAWDGRQIVNAPGTGRFLRPQLNGLANV